jgi:hypothetical protein
LDQIIQQVIIFSFVSVVSGGLFSIVSFDNVPCNADSGDIGTCYSARECTNLGGSAIGICAGNYGVCCVGKSFSNAFFYRIVD